MQPAMHPAGLLNDRVVLITGAAAGIGRATALLAAREGARLALFDANEDGVATTAALVSQAGGRAIWQRVDVTKPGDVASMLEMVVREYGQFHHCFNNAGVAQWHCGGAGLKVAELTQDIFARVIEVNLIGTWLCMRAQIEHLLAHGGGSIVNTASIAGLVGMAQAGAYAASKHAVVGLSKSAALEYAQAGIRINCLCPGFTDTSFVQSVMATRPEQVLASVPMRRLASPEEVAEMAVWLMSDRASYVTGAALPVDGGFAAA